MSVVSRDAGLGSARSLGLPAWTCLLVLLLAGCAPVFFPDAAQDLDGDGHVPPEDCDDLDAAANPAYPEVCDGIDNDCDGLVDGEDLLDGDGDGFDGCADCDDADNQVAPGLAEACDGADTDCDGVVPADERDADGDGFLACAECDDADPSVRPGAAEVCDGADTDCDGAVDDADTELPDADGDGAGPCSDCDDGSAARAPGLAESCDGLDNDCDDTIPADESDDDEDGVRVCAGDCDDAHAGVAAGLPEACDGLDGDCDSVIPPGEQDGDGDGAAPCEGDCDDARADVGPGAPETCDGSDEDCDGVVPPPEVDLDGDGYAPCAGDCDEAREDVAPGLTERCDGVDDDCDGLMPGEGDGDGDGALACADCDDGLATAAPGLPEECDGIDNDCDGLADGEGDADGDGAFACADCDDEDAAIGPEATEACDGIDGDCDGGLPAAELDADGDGSLACEDCDDADGARSPYWSESCNGIDDDCDGLVDGDDLGDGDGDGFDACVDCDDGDADASPGSSETCDGADDDCDGLVDEASFLPSPALFVGGAPGGALWAWDLSGGLAGPVVDGLAPPTGASRAAATADLDGDGATEIVQQRSVVGDPSANDLTIWRATCAGTFGGQAGPPLPPGATVIAGGDLDGDGRDDVLVADGSALLVLRGDGGLADPVSAGTLVAPGLGLATLLAARLVDFDGDGAPDLLECASTASATTCWLHRGVGDGTLHPGTTVVLQPVPSASIAVGDADGDGDHDALIGFAATGDPGAVYLLPGDGAGSLGSAVEFVDLNPAEESGAGGGQGSGLLFDLDGDGVEELLTVHDPGVDGVDRTTARWLPGGAGIAGSSHWVVAASGPPPSLAVALP